MIGHYKRFFGENHRPSDLANISFVRLPTLTCAPYLALRCLQQLALEAERTYSLASEILRRDIYVDDILSESDDLSATKDQFQ